MAETKKKTVYTHFYQLPEMKWCEFTLRVLTFFVISSGIIVKPFNVFCTVMYDAETLKPTM